MTRDWDWYWYWYIDIGMLLPFAIPLMASWSMLGQTGEVNEQIVRLFANFHTGKADLVWPFSLPLV